MSRRTQVFSTALAALLVLSTGGRVKQKYDTIESDDQPTLKEIENGVYETKITIPMEGGEDVVDEITVFDNTKIAKGMMKPDPSFSKHKHLQYVIWMDQAGQYASSTGMPRRFALPDALVQIAQKGQEIGADGWQTIKTTTKGWSWFWTDAGREEYIKLRQKKGLSHNMVKWNNEARTTGNFYGLINPDINSFVEKYITNIGFTLMPYWDCKLNNNRCEEAAKVTCPPEKESERYHCAMWERWNYAGFLSVGTYYAFAVVDPNGEPVEPYFSAFQEAMKTNKFAPQQQFVGNVAHPDFD